MGRQPTQTELRQAEQLVSSFFQSSKVGLAILDREFRYSLVNPYLAAVHRTTAESHVGKHLKEVLGTVAPGVEAAIREVFSTGRAVVNCGFMGIFPTRGETGQWIANYFPITDLNGAVTEVAAVVVELGTDVHVNSTGTGTSTTASILRSWKDIASYLGTCVKTVQRWEKLHNLPVRRTDRNKGAVVFALTNEMDEWLRGRNAGPQRRETKSKLFPQPS